MALYEAPPRRRVLAREPLQALGQLRLQGPLDCLESLVLMHALARRGRLQDGAIDHPAHEVGPGWEQAIQQGMERGAVPSPKREWRSVTG
jgi:hypothetical protein